MDANNLKKAFELFVKLQDKKVKLSNVDGKIKYRAPSGIMTNEVIEEIRLYRASRKTMERKARRQFSINRCTVCVFDWKKKYFSIWKCSVPHLYGG